MKEESNILNRADAESSVHAYYGRDKEENPQEFIPPLDVKSKYSEEEIEMLENGIKKIPLEEALFLLK